ncbi:deoxycytidylate deaminase-like [Kryptolebias marmoratus]|uniref:deoxycytidylate deaminase-like n=1 Tax=Kryptolebias marmoratus TaxID=37003 RepID=UPI000D5306EA|nr:deoxycytidylate deaminase-like [Kryptolebias marmoratus]
MDDKQQPANRTLPREPRLSLGEYFMAFARLAAEMSRDPNTQVGACIVKDGKIVGTGYNAMPNGCTDLPWSNDNPDWLQKKYAYVCHAELNAIVNKFSADVKGCTMYVTLFPCNECAKLIIQTGIAKVVYLSDKYHDKDEMKASKAMLKEAKVELSPFSSQKEVKIPLTPAEVEVYTIE